MEQYRLGARSAEGIALELEVSARRVRQLYAGYLQAVADGQGAEWEPGRSGGNRQREIPPSVAGLWRRLLSTQPPAPYGFMVSEAFRRCDFTIDRATARRWALEHGLAHSRPKDRTRAPVQRWQAQRVGELWQLDASPHRWLGPGRESFPLLDMVDDCTRVITGARVYPRECQLAYLDFLRRAFEEYGLPLQLYVDYHSLFFSVVPDALTYLGECLRFYGISFRYAPTPQAKGKIERLHLFWQNRLPAYAQAEGITDVPVLDQHLQPLRVHHNQHEIHRELQMTPQQAWRAALREKRSVLRPKPPCPWWPYIWTIRCNMQVDLHQQVSAGTLRLRIARPPFSRVTRCEHPDGAFTFLAQAPGTGGRPIVLLRVGPTGTPWNV
jgi:hypothetical protein